MFLTLLLMRSFKISRLNSPGILARFLEPAVHDERIEWQVIDREIESYSDPVGTVALCLGTSIGACWLTAEQLLKIHYFKGGKILGQKYPPQTEIIIGCIITAIIVIWSLYRVNPRRILNRAVLAKITKASKSLEARLAGLSELAALEKKIVSTGASWGIRFPAGYSQEIRNYLAENKNGLMTKLDELNVLVAQNIAAARSDHEKLEKAYHHYNDTLTMHERISNDVVSSGSILLIKQMEKLYEGMQSPNIRILVEQKRWTDFHRILDMMRGNIHRLGDRAGRYGESNQGIPYDDDNLEMSPEGAYRILGLTSSATDQQIKQVYYRLAQIYHPDKNISQDDSRFKLINSAYLVLKNERGF